MDWGKYSIQSEINQSLDVSIYLSSYRVSAKSAGKTTKFYLSTIKDPVRLRINDRAIATASILNITIKDTVICIS
jgi:hypothetical protein